MQYIYLYFHGTFVNNTTHLATEKNVLYKHEIIITFLR